MLNTVYQLVRPRRFEIAFSEIDLNAQEVIVHPTHLSICNADQRYYQGKRPEEILRKKLPMALIHEAVGEVILDPTGHFRAGQKVVMIPNTPAESDPVIAENYLRSSRFRASSLDGFMQEYVSMAPDRLVLLPEGLNDLVASFTEMVSVCYHAVSRFDKTAHSRRDSIGIWGDGNMGYFTSLMLRQRFPDARLTVFGVNEGKLNDFSFADDVCVVNAIPASLTVDHAFECVGGAGAGNVINQIIDHIAPEGTIAILGVSEDPVPVNTRMVLEKGLRILGTSRSGRSDFEGLVSLYRERPETVSYLERMIGSVVDVRGIPDMTLAFERDITKEMGKTVMVWH